MSEMRELTLPALGESIDSATVTRWLKGVGDSVEVDEPVLEVATDKVDSEVVAPFAGVISAILVSEDETAEIGQVLATIAPVGSGTVPSDSAPAPASSAIAASSAPPAAAPSPGAPATGPVAPAPAPAAATTAEPQRSESSRVEKLSPIRRIIADRMMHSLQSTAQLTSVVEIDVSRIAAKRSVLKAEGRPTSFLSFFIHAALEALAAHPVINSTIDPTGTELTIHDSVDLGIAVDSPRGLMVPVIRDAQSLDVHALGDAISDLAGRVRDGGIAAAELSGGTFTVTNTGSRGALFDTPILNSPQSAILGTGVITRRVVPIGEGFQIGVRSFAYFSLTYDHRVVDGADAARYLSEVKRIIETY